MVVLGKVHVDNVLYSKLTPEIRDAVRRVKVGVAGLGGLGSNVAEMLMRSGVSNITIADFDTVEMGNIYKQNYYLEQIGMAKVDATEENLNKINSFAVVEKHNVRLDPTNIPHVFRECTIVCECLDAATEKAMFINTMMEKRRGVNVISGSGMAGIGRSNEIKTERVFDYLYMCGDGIDMADNEDGLMSPRINICAAHMANLVLSLIMKKEP